jgi:hypothetical protein
VFLPGNNWLSLLALVSVNGQYKSSRVYDILIDVLEWLEPSVLSVS